MREIWNKYKVILVQYIQCIKYPIFEVSLEFQGVKINQS